MIRFTSSIVFACTSKACAPPPVGTGGSTPSGHDRAAGLEEYIRTNMRGDPGKPGAAERKYSASLKVDYALKRDIKPSDFSDPGVAVANYMSHMFETVNEYLRGNFDNLNESDLSAAPDLVVGMDKAFEQFGVPLRERTILYRGLDIDRGIDSVRRRFKKGDVVSDPAYVSTSHDQHEARRFYGAQHRGLNTQVLMRITAPKGTRVLGGVSDEAELILDRDTKLKVTSVKEEVPGRLVVNVQVLK